MLNFSRFDEVGKLDPRRIRKGRNTQGISAEKKDKTRRKAKAQQRILHSLRPMDMVEMGAAALLANPTSSFVSKVRNQPKKSKSLSGLIFGGFGL